MSTDNLRLVRIAKQYMQKQIEKTGSHEFMEKGSRPYVGLYDYASGWFIPLRANINPKKPQNSQYITPFSTLSNHFMRPGLDFQKAVFVPNREHLTDLPNTLPKEQWDFICDHQKDINSKFAEYVCYVTQLPEQDRERKWSTVPYFETGVTKIVSRYYNVNDNQEFEGPIL